MKTIDQTIAEYIKQNLEVNGWPLGNLLLCAIAIILSLVLCGAIGIERERRGRNAGLRTHLLVGVGSCILTIISIYGFPTGSDYDVARLVAQVVAGVGFLGAGVIIYKNGGTRGLTTAGTIWITMAIGVACGSFNFILAAIGTGVILAVLVTFKRFEAKLNAKDSMVEVLALADKPVVKAILDSATELNCQIHDLKIEQGEGTNTIEMVFHVKFENSKGDINAFISLLQSKVEIQSINALNNKN